MSAVRLARLSGCLPSALSCTNIYLAPCPAACTDVLHRIRPFAPLIAAAPIARAALGDSRRCYASSKSRTPSDRSGSKKTRNAADVGQQRSAPQVVEVNEDEIERLAAATAAAARVRHSEPPPDADEDTFIDVKPRAKKTKKPEGERRRRGILIFSSWRKLRLNH